MELHVFLVCLLITVVFYIYSVCALNKHLKTASSCSDRDWTAYTELNLASQDVRVDVIHGFLLPMVEQPWKGG